MTGKIFRSIITVAMAVLLAALLVVTGLSYDHFSSIQEDELKSQLAFAAAGTELEGVRYLERLEPDPCRLTWVAPDGTVLYDSHSDPDSMENHADREEISQAMNQGTGSSYRYSVTRTEKTHYEAIRLSDGSVLRISVSRITATTLALGMVQPMLVIAVLAILVSIALARGMARRVVEPIRRIAMDGPEQPCEYEELEPLLTQLRYQHREIETQVKTLKRKTAEFEQISRGLREALVLMDAQGRVLSINGAACALFDTDPLCVGKTLVSVAAEDGLECAVEEAFSRGYSELRCTRGSREYQLELNRIDSEGVAVGMALLALDLSPQQDAERSRQEFTANVSHELKTPLQSIIGSAELMENGLVKAEDLPRFVGRIRQEATRLVTLIDDIIRLSQLEEGGELPREQLCLKEISEEVLSALQGAAESAGLSLSVSGQCCMSGVRGLLFEIIYNLCDNAIKYNRPGGEVRVELSETEHEAVLTVRDSGIGIPPEHQSRIFERFYRVDKSHSRQSGGTGLGLSIVKHAVQQHRGRISLDSRPGEGTVFTITFPKD